MLTLQASGGSGGADITAFIEGVEIIDAQTGRLVPNVVLNASFEAPARSGYTYGPVGGGWVFASNAGIASNGSEFGNPVALHGSQVAFIQSLATSGNGSLHQALLPLAAGVYQVRLRVAQRACCYGTPDQGVRVLVDGQLLGVIVPDRDGQYHTYTSSSFTVAPAQTVPAKGGRR